MLFLCEESNLRPHNPFLKISVYICKQIFWFLPLGTNLDGTLGYNLIFPVSLPQLTVTSDAT
jgi:hypothetical protein